MSKQKYTITILSENTPGVLYRIANLFLRRKINVESLTVSETIITNISRFTIVVVGDKDIIEKVTKQLYKIIEVIKVTGNTDDEIIYQEIALMKVHAANITSKKELSQLITMGNAAVKHFGETEFIIEKSGTEEEINGFISLMKPFGIKEIVRSGRIALAKK